MEPMTVWVRMVAAALLGPVLALVPLRVVLLEWRWLLAYFPRVDFWGSISRLAVFWAEYPNCA